MNGTARTASRRAVLAVTLATVALSSCAVGRGHPAADTPGPDLHRDLAARPGEPAPARLPAVTVTSASSGSVEAGPARGAATERSATATTVAPAGAPEAVPATVVDDTAGDQGGNGPPYTDIRAVRLERAGDLVRVTVTVASPVPTKLPTAEVMGVGVDFSRDGTGESDYQLFADGEADGWFAYLQTPSGFVQYPGTFDLAGDRIVFTVPASSLGDNRRPLVQAFVDWSRSGTPSSVEARDRAPDGGRAPAAV